MVVIMKPGHSKQELEHAIKGMERGGVSVVS